MESRGYTQGCAEIDECKVQYACRATSQGGYRIKEGRQTVPCDEPHGIIWDAAKIGSDMYLKVHKVKHCSWGMIVGILPAHFIFAVNGVKIADLGTTNDEWAKAMRMTIHPPKPGDFLLQIPTELHDDPNTIVGNRYAGGVKGWSNMVAELGNQPRYKHFQTTHEQVERMKMH